MKKTIICLIIVLLLTSAETIQAGYTIDADLSDWGVTPFVDWEPVGTADWEESDNLNIYDVASHDQILISKAAALRLQEVLAK